MKILTQDRIRIFNFSGNVWAADISGQGYIVTEKVSGSPYVGTYKDIDRATEVLREIFQYYRAGEKSYIMPEE